MSFLSGFKTGSGHVSYCKFAIDPMHKNDIRGEFGLGLGFYWVMVRILFRVRVSLGILLIEMASMIFQTEFADRHKHSLEVMFTPLA